MAATVKHARIDSDVPSPVPAASQPPEAGVKFLQTPAAASTRKNSLAAGAADTGAASASKMSALMAKLGGGGVAGGDAGSETKSTLGDAMKRRRSTFKGLASNMLSLRRMTKGSNDKDMLAAAAAAAAAANAKPKVRMENTYRMTPDPKDQFSSTKARAMIHDVLKSQLEAESYSATKAPTQAAVLSERVKAAVKKLNCDRYKLVVTVALGPVQEQGMVVASRCVWDVDNDTSSTITYNNGKIFAIANVFAVYFE